MDLNALRYFVAAAEAGSLSEAARRTGVPLPTLSRRVRGLEAELGMRLLERGPRGLALTRAGTRLLSDAGPALVSLAQAEQGLRDVSGVAGVLRVSVPPHFEPIWRVFDAFRQHHPAVRFDVFVTERRVDLVADGVDVVIRVGEGGQLSYVGRVLGKYRHQVLASPELLARHPIEQPADLGAAPTVCWRTGEPAAWWLGGERVELQPLLVTNDYPQLLALALEGVAITELPPFLSKEAVGSGRLVPVLPQQPMPELQLRALVVERRSMSPLVREFLDFSVSRVGAELGM